jgi:hypothetical protein
MFTKLIANLKLFLFKLCFKPTTKKIIHLYKIRKGYAGEYVGLGVSSELTNQYMKEFGFNSLSFGVVDDNKIDKILYDERPDFLIVKAFWIRKEKLELLAKKYKKTKFIVVSHSKPTFLGTETNGFNRLFEVIDLSKKYENIFVGSNNLDFVLNSNGLVNNIFYVPNIILPKLNNNKRQIESDKIKIGLFCAIRPMKNILNQVIASISAAEELNKKLELYVITNRVEMGGDVTLKNLKDLFKNLDSEQYKLIELDWMEWKDFNNKIKEIDLGLQSSFTETFNIVAVDFINNNIPVVTSPSIEWSSNIFKTNPDSIYNIKIKIKSFYLIQDLVEKGLNESYLGLINYNIESLKHLDKIFKK